jgi:hypothetical protein
MNHISKSFVTGDGRAHKCHSWESREGGYRRAALLVGNGVWPVDKETRLISFLMDRGFRVLSLDLAFGSPEAPRVSLRAFREAIAAYAREATPLGLPLYLIASSFSGGALLPALGKIDGIAAAALLAPVVEFPPAGLRKSLFFMPTAELSLGREEQSGCPELLEGLAEGRSTLKFRKRDLKAAAAELAATLGKPLGVTAAAFVGEDDRMLSQGGRDALAKAGAKIYSYPRVRHVPAHDRYSDNFFADLGSFLDEAEAGKAR